MSITLITFRWLRCQTTRYIEIIICNIHTCIRRIYTRLIFNKSKKSQYVYRISLITSIYIRKMTRIHSASYSLLVPNLCKLDNNSHVLKLSMMIIFVINIVVVVGLLVVIWSACKSLLMAVLKYVFLFNIILYSLWRHFGLCWCTQRKIQVIFTITPLCTTHLIFYTYVHLIFKYYIMVI